MNVNAVFSIDYLLRVSFDHQKPNKDEFTCKVLHLRLKDKHDSYLRSHTKQVNTVWNFCNEHSMKVLAREHRFCSAYDIHPYLAGSVKEGIELHSQTIQAITEEYVTRRKQFKKSRLNWRVSQGSRRSLGWIPFKSSAIAYKAGQVVLNGKKLSLWDSYGLADYDLGSGSISQDARGRWYLNVTVKVRTYTLPLKPERTIIGIDLGLKDFLATSEGQKEESQKLYRKAEASLAVAQRANKTNRVRAIHAKIANQRKDFHHKLSTDLVRACDGIFVGNVNSNGLAKTSMAKSVLDSGWSSFRTMLKYKCHLAGVWFNEVNEAYSTQTCSCCGERTGPKGQAELDVRDWTCSNCTAEHSRDINAAINIKNTGLKWMINEIATIVDERSSEAIVNKNPQGFGVGYGPLVAGIWRP